MRSDNRIRHPETQRSAARQRVEERLLFDGVYLDSCNIPERDIKDTIVVVAYPADAVPTRCDFAPVSACNTADPFIGHGLGQLAFCSMLCEQIMKCECFGHNDAYSSPKTYAENRTMSRDVGV